AGSYAELGDQALGVDPRDTGATAEALHAALSMPAPERYARAEALRDAVMRHQLHDWLECQLDDLGVVRRGPPAVSLADAPSAYDMRAKVAS
ncbi:MAG TPA: trehalose-6-phosphate synthase, partial [Dehalococcoidia bacterium]